jgi:cytochrome b subunit of formate dehydrogenase
MKYPRVRPRLTYIRILGNIALVVGQFVLLFLDRKVGLLILITGSILSLPFFVKKKQWDVVAVIVVGITLNVFGLIHSPVPN